MGSDVPSTKVRTADGQQGHGFFFFLYTAVVVLCILLYDVSHAYIWFILHLVPGIDVRSARSHRTEYGVPRYNTLYLQCAKYTDGTATAPVTPQLQQQFVVCGVAHVVCQVDRVS